MRAADGTPQGGHRDRNAPSGSETDGPPTGPPAGPEPSAPPAPPAAVTARDPSRPDTAAAGLPRLPQPAGATALPDAPSGGAPRPPVRRVAWSLLKDTVGTCMHYRVTGLAAEAAFFTLLSLPPLLLGLVGMLGYLDRMFATGTIDEIRANILEASQRFLSPEGVNELVVPLLDSVFDRARPDLVSIGFLIALWSGSRAVNVFVDTITIMYGLDGRRGIVRTRLLAFLLYLIALLLGTVVLPLLVAGPDQVRDAVPELAGPVDLLYWPVVVVLSVIFLTTLYHLSVPARTPWREDLPGAFVALLLWLLGSALLRLYLATAIEGPSVYGSLAAPIAVLLWLGLTAMAVLIGAAVNAAVDRIWPSRETASARAQAEREVERAAREVVEQARARREGDLERAEGPGPGTAVPAEFPERWAAFLPPGDVRGRLPGGRYLRRPWRSWRR